MAEHGSPFAFPSAFPVRPTFAICVSSSVRVARFVPYWFTEENERSEETTFSDLVSRFFEYW
jgi:hypothetical protein